MDTVVDVPGVLSTKRITMLLASVLVSLGSGTNYVYSAYSPQLGARLRINHTQLNVIGLAGNMGVYTTSPLMGRFVDRHGPKWLLVTGFVSLLGGYLGLRAVYDGEPPAPRETISTFTFALMIWCSYMTGAGGNAGLTSSMNSSAKTFPERTRATITGIVISGFGLSAFVFSLLAHKVFPGDTSSLLLVLALGTSFPFILGFFLVRPIPLPAEELMVVHAETTEEFQSHHRSHSRTRRHENESNVPLLSNELDTPVDFLDDRSDSRRQGQRQRSIEMSPTRSLSPRHRVMPRVDRKAQPKSVPSLIKVPTNIHGRSLFKNLDFWLLFSYLSLLSGTGLMYINNVGSISQALYAHEQSDYDEVKAGAWQAAQVSTISLTNFFGRIAIGLTADLTKDFFHVPRSYCMMIVASVFLVSQLMAVTVHDVRHLWVASAWLGLSYGGLFGLTPTIVIEYFGLPHYSENWGFISLSPLIGGNLFSVAFGRNLDAHTPPHVLLPPSNSTLIPPSSAQCLQGRGCYVDTFYLTIFACSIALIIACVASWRDRRRAKMVDNAGPVPRDVTWDEEEDNEEV